MSSLYILIPAALVGILIIIRRLWILANIETYTLTASWYCWRTKQPNYVTKEMGELWPTSYMFWEFWHWDFRRYIVHQEHHDAMVEQIVEDLSKTDLGWEIFQDKTTPPAPPVNNNDSNSTHGSN
jgi:hypothetical protein